MTRRIPVKLAPGEIVLPPRVAAQHRERLEQMNREGLLARNMGGVVNYRKHGGMVRGYQEGGEVAPLPGAVPPNTQKFLGADVPVGAVGNLGASLVAIGQHDFKGASEALARELPEGEDTDKTEKEQDTVQSLVDKAAKACLLYTSPSPRDS